MRWLLLDEILTIERNKIARSRSHIAPDSYSPEVLMIEMMAQTGALLLGAENDFHEDLVFAKIDKAVFDGHFREGGPLLIESSSENLRREGAWFEGRIFKGAREIANARFLLMNVGHLIPGRVKPVTFHEAFMNYFQVRDKVKS